MAIDEVRIWVKAGDGGKGCESFYRSKYMRRARADGGCGGNGGSVVLQADSSLNNLRDFHFRQHFKAPSGKHGSSKKKRGSDANDLIIKVPLGTIVKDATTGKVLRDLSDNEVRLVVAKGGRGGIGNAFTKDKKAIPPTEGEERELILELKHIADVGIIGLPSVGKSSLLNALTSAGSKVAPYYFTTRNPVLGVLQDWDVVVADIPGIIEDAHKGKGLGYKFLRHVERSKILLHVIDVSKKEREDPWHDYLVLNQELRQYNPDLLKKRQVIVLNKIDLLGGNVKEEIEIFSKNTRSPVVAVSAKTMEGVSKLKKVIGDLLKE